MFSRKILPLGYHLNISITIIASVKLCKQLVVVRDKDVTINCFFKRLEFSPSAKMVR